MFNTETDRSRFEVDLVRAAEGTNVGSGLLQGKCRYDLLGRKPGF